MTPEDVTRLRAKVSRLLPSELHVLDALIASALRRPTGGHALGRVAVEQQSARPDPRAEAEPLKEEPTRRERRSSEQVAAVVRRPASGSFKAATRILTDATAKLEEP